MNVSRNGKWTDNKDQSRLVFSTSSINLSSVIVCATEHLTNKPDSRSIPEESPEFSRFSTSFHRSTLSTVAAEDDVRRDGSSEKSSAFASKCCSLKVVVSLKDKIVNSLVSVRRKLSSAFVY